MRGRKVRIIVILLSLATLLSGCQGNRLSGAAPFGGFIHMRAEVYELLIWIKGRLPDKDSVRDALSGRSE